MTRFSGRLLILAGTLSFGSLFGLSTGDSIAHFSVRGSVPAIVTPPTMGGLENGGEVQPFGTIDESHFVQGYVEADSANRIHMEGMNSNVPVAIRVQNNGWDLPAGYDTIDGPKRADGSDSDFLFYIDPSSVTAARGDIAPLGTFGSQFTGVTNVPTDLLRMGSDPGSGRWIGVRNGDAWLTPRMNLDPVYDIPGDYVAHIEMTISLPLP